MFISSTVIQPTATTTIIHPRLYYSSYITSGSSTQYTPITSNLYYSGTSNYITSSTGYITSIIYNDIIPEPYVPPKIDYRGVRLKRDYARKALWKSIRLFENLFGINQIQLFLNGQSFEIIGRKFNYRISKKNYINLIDHTSRPTSCCIPYRLEVLSKSGLVLFEGCTVFKNTPIIDQIIALILHIQNDEEHVLLNMNLSKLSLNFLESSNDVEYINKLKGTKYAI